MKRFVLICAIFAVLCCGLRLAMGLDSLTFEASTTSNVVYRLKWSTNSAGAAAGSLELGTNRFLALTNGPWGRFYYRVLSVTTNNIESDPSNEVLGTNRPVAPLQLQIQTVTNAVILQGSFNGETWKDLGVFTTNALELALQRYQLIRAKVGPPPMPGGAP